MIGYLSIPVLAVTVLVQATVMPEFRLGGGMPDLVLLIVLSVSLISGIEQGLVWALVGGFLYDLISAVPLGTTALSLVVTVTLAYMAVGRANPRSLILPPLVAVAGTMVAQVASMVVLVIVGRPLPLLDLLSYITLPSMIYNGALMFLVYRIVGSVYISGRPRRVSGL